MIPNHHVRPRQIIKRQLVDRPVRDLPGALQEESRRIIHLKDVQVAAISDYSHIGESFECVRCLVFCRNYPSDVISLKEVTKLPGVIFIDGFSKRRPWPNPVGESSGNP